MPGPQDQLSEQRQADYIRPLDRNPTIAELRERLERLPPNHPSSPRYDDGTRQPPEPELRIRELQPSGDADSRPGTDTASRDLPTEDPPRIHPDGSWEWKGRSLNPEQLRAGDLMLERCREAEGRNVDGSYGEHGLTPAMRRIEADSAHGHLADNTEEFALKSPDRFREKLATLCARFPNRDSAELAFSIHDAIRYSFIFDLDHYTEGVQATQDQLTAAGYERIETKPGWDRDEYKGVNSQWSDPASGLIFEIQFHIQESWDAKQITHDAYERISMPEIPVQELEGLRDFQRGVSARVPIPPGALDIPAFKRGLYELGN